MKIKDVTTLFVNAGWRPWIFVRIETRCGIVGWSECTDSHGSPNGIKGIIDELAVLIVDKDPTDINAILLFLRSRTRQSPGSIIHKAIAGIENALWDIMGKQLGIPVHHIFGGAIRENIPVYWSHFGTTRVRAASIVNKMPIVAANDIAELIDDFNASGINTIKTNIPTFIDGPQIYMPGFAKGTSSVDSNLTPELKRAVTDWVKNLRENLGDDAGIAIDLNYNFSFEAIRILSEELEPFKISWFEIDTANAIALANLRHMIKTPICSGENLYGLDEYKPFFNASSMDIASVDVIWNGLKSATYIAKTAEGAGMNVCPHNYNGHISTAISMTFCSLIENFRVAEIDIDDVPWRDELFTNQPEIVNGHYKVTNQPGWGIDLNEKVAKKYEWHQ